MGGKRKRRITYWLLDPVTYEAVRQVSFEELAEMLGIKYKNEIQLHNYLKARLNTIGAKPVNGYVIAEE